ncbi:MAG: TlpA family protein disulfide reductase [Firmicutes bacterium]|nr:TlpA family protein disulfide reductase [Bacillota bacterium]
MPVLEGLNKKYANKNVAVLGILLDPQREEWAQQAVKETGTTFPHLKDDGSFAPHIFGVPQTILVDPSGIILEHVVGFHSLEQFGKLLEKHL